MIFYKSYFRRGFSTSPRFLNWTRSRAGQYHREFDQFERFMHDLSSVNTECGTSKTKREGAPVRGNWDVIAGIQIEWSEKSELIEERARAAWRRLRYKHPSIAAHLSSGGWTYTIAAHENLEKWGHETFVSVDTSEAASFHEEKRPTMYFLRDLGEFRLHCPHSYLDGLGAAILFHDFLLELAGDDGKKVWGTRHPGDEVTNLPKSLWSAADISHDTADTSSDDQLIHLPRSEILCGLPSITGGNNTPENTRIERVRLSTHQTEALYSTAKSRGLSVTHLVHAALAQAIKDIEGPVEWAQASALLLTNLRNFCTGDPALGSRAAALRIGIWPIEFAVHGLWGTAIAIREAYRGVLNSQRSSLPIMVPVLQKLLHARHPPLCESVILSSLGNVTPYLRPSYNDIKLRDFWATMRPMDSSIPVHLHSLFGRGNISFHYNRSYHTDQQIKMFMGLMRETLTDVCRWPN